MKTALVGMSDTYTGAGIAARRLHAALRAEGVDSTYHVQAEPAHPGVHRIPGQSTVPERVARRLERATGLANLFVRSTGALLRDPRVEASDVLHVHQMLLYSFGHRWLARASAKKPVVLTLHDMWPLTGHCVFSDDCGRWETGCGKCPYPRMWPPVRIDTTAMQWRIKRSVYRRSRLTVVTPSEWLADIARRSILSRFDVHAIPNAIDTTVFRPGDRAAARRRFGLSESAKVILFASASVLDERKGGLGLLRAVSELSRSANGEYALLLIGRLPPEQQLPDAGGASVVATGYLGDDESLADACRAADVLAIPSRVDNFPCVIQEASACGTPAIGCDVGGIPEMIRDGVTGRVVRRGDAEALGRAIGEALGDADLRTRWGAAAREHAAANWNASLVARRHVALYESLRRDG